MEQHPDHSDQASRPVVVVGGGIVGSAIAWELQRRSTDTLLIERDSWPQGATTSSFASLSALDEPLDELYRLKCRGMEGWRLWQQELGDDLGVTWEGEIRMAETAEAASMLRLMVGRGEQRGYPVEWLDLEELQRHLPGLSLERVQAVSLAPRDGQVSPTKAIPACGQLSRKRAAPC